MMKSEKIRLLQFHYIQPRQQTRRLEGVERYWYKEGPTDRFLSRHVVYSCLTCGGERRRLQGL